MMRLRFHSVSIPLLSFCILSFWACAKDPVEVRERLGHRNVITGLDTPWEVLWGPDDRLWVTERNGRLSRVNPQTGDQVVVATIPDVEETGEAGLLGMALHQAGDVIRVYLAYTYRDNDDDLRERLVRYDYNGSTLVNRMELLAGIPANSNHNGSRLMIVGDKLFMTTGDAQNSSEAQDHRSISGKVLRLNLDGTVPADNPWAGAPYPTNFLWTTGHRNIQGLIRASNEQVYASEHGPESDDELNIIEKGRNYGWPEVKGYCEGGEIEFCADSTVAQPIKAWTPTIAVCGIEYYDNAAVPSWQGSLLMVTLKEGDLRLLKLDSGGRLVVEEKIYYNEAWGRLRDVCIAPDGRIFLATSNKDGRGDPKEGDDRIILLDTERLVKE